jgi:hypothetical protein
MTKADWLWSGLLVLGWALACVASWAFAQSPGNPEMQLKTAIAHAGFAAKADAVNGVTLHLHHVLNCMVGPQDTRFDTVAGNPCQGQGNGALSDIKPKTGQDLPYYEAWWVAQIASQGIASKNLQEAKAAAHIVGLILHDATKGK